jgi:hypothetical protein
VPHLRPHASPELKEATRQLLKMEKADSVELHRLREQLDGGPESSLLPLLVDLMINDTAKHIAILSFIRSRL